MPFRVNHESGLYEMSYTVGRTLEDARQIASSFRLVDVPPPYMGIMTGGFTLLKPFVLFINLDHLIISNLN